MAEDAKKLIVILSRGIDDERTTVAWTLANGGVNEGLDVTVFIVAAGADVVRKGQADRVQLNPEDPPMRELIAGFQAGGGNIWVCPPCAKLRSYTVDDFIDGVEIVGAPPVMAQIKDGAAVICF